ncbi:hypothetical protein [Staphylococcus phage phiSP119-1]|nr:hypothetical protein [Staphylococcus phage phiSP119-1]EJO7160608.1 hypothetical protein [Staphylococcus pseudintermedius]
MNLFKTQIITKDAIINAKIIEIISLETHIDITDFINMKTPILINENIIENIFLVSNFSVSNNAK